MLLRQNAIYQDSGTEMTALVLETTDLRTRSSWPYNTMQQRLSLLYYINVPQWLTSYNLCRHFTTRVPNKARLLE